MAAEKAAAEAAAEEKRKADQLALSVPGSLKGDSKSVAAAKKTGNYKVRHADCCCPTLPVLKEGGCSRSGGAPHCCLAWCDGCAPRDWLTRGGHASHSDALIPHPPSVPLAVSGSAAQTNTKTDKVGVAKAAKASPAAKAPSVRPTKSPSAKSPSAKSPKKAAPSFSPTAAGKKASAGMKAPLKKAGVGEEVGAAAGRRRPLAVHWPREEGVLSTRAPWPRPWQMVDCAPRQSAPLDSYTLDSWCVRVPFRWTRRW